MPDPLHHGRPPLQPARRDSLTRREGADSSGAPALFASLSLHNVYYAKYADFAATGRVGRGQVVLTGVGGHLISQMI